MTHKLFARSLIILSTEANTRQIFATLEGSYSLCLLANLIHLGSMDKTVLVGLLFDFTVMPSAIFEEIFYLSCNKIKLGSFYAKKWVYWLVLNKFFAFQFPNCHFDSLRNSLCARRRGGGVYITYWSVILWIVTSYRSLYGAEPELEKNFAPWLVWFSTKMYFCLKFSGFDFRTLSLVCLRNAVNMWSAKNQQWRIGIQSWAGFPNQLIHSK